MKDIINVFSYMTQNRKAYRNILSTDWKINIVSYETN